MRRKIRVGRVIGIIMVAICIVSLCVGFLLSLFTRLAVQDTKTSFYDLNAFVNQNGFKVYQDSNYESLKAVDVSAHQKGIDWKQVKSAGIDFAMIRCGYRGAIEGILHEDDYFHANMQGAISSGLDVGVYFFSSAITMEELEEEAYYVLDLVKGYKLQYPIAYDMEFYQNDQGRITQLSQEEKTQFALRFCEIIESHGYDSMIYGNIDWLTNQLNYDEIKQKEIWYAAYQDIPSFNHEFKMWQYSESARLPGISTPCDMNIYLKRK